MLVVTPPSSILLIKWRHHGDVLLTTPVARTLRENFPASKIDLLVYEGTEPLVKNNPDLRHIWSWNRSAHGWRKLWKYLQIFRLLRAQRYDWVLHLSDQMQGAFLAKLLAHKCSVGIDYPKRRNFLWRFCFTHLAPLFESNTRHTVEQNLATLACLDIHATSDQERCRLQINQEDRVFIQKTLQEAAITTPYLVVHPAARWFFKCWEDDRFAEVIHYFTAQGWPIVLTSSPEEQEKAMVASILQKIDFFRNSTVAANCVVAPVQAASQQSKLKGEVEVKDKSEKSNASTGNLNCREATAPEAPVTSSASASLERSLAKSPFVISLAGQLTLGQLAALIEGSRLFLGVDSVPMHMAAALQKDTVALFGPSKINEWHPWKTRYRLLKASDYGPLLDPDAVTTNTTQRYLSNIPVAPVVKAVEELLVLPEEARIS